LYYDRLPLLRESNQELISRNRLRNGLQLIIWEARRYLGNQLLQADEVGMEFVVTG
jgi:hypothetical protein